MKYHVYHSRDVADRPLATVSTTIFVLEPVFFWPDEMKALHRASVEPGHLKKLRGFPENLEARQLMRQLKEVLDPKGIMNRGVLVLGDGR